jgi:hypothetical protein
MTKEQSAITIEDARELYGLLRGGPAPEGFTLCGRPKLSARVAFSVIYVLQEKYHLIPDTFEQCVACLDLFDSAESGHYDDQTGKHYCDSCIPAKVRT